MASKKNTSRSRRRLLKTLSIGTVAASGKLVPDTWTRPVVASVMLPVHAEATGQDEPPPPDCGPQFTYGTGPAGTLIGSYSITATAIFSNIPDGIGYFCNWTVPGGGAGPDHNATATGGYLTCTASYQFTCGTVGTLHVALQDESNSILCSSPEIPILQTCPS